MEDVDRCITFRTELIAPRMLQVSKESSQEREAELMLVNSEINRYPTPLTGIGRLTTADNENDDMLSTFPLPINDSVIDFGTEDHPVEQYAHSVLDFSSQYGIDLSISYTAPNITGQPNIYPECGDFPQTFAMARNEILLLFKRFFKYTYLLENIRTVVEQSAFTTTGNTATKST